ncbi:peptidylprolyl isomerase [Cognatiyoonia sp.]|uniref:peptidylprolyl isomerase n=1 Tax=Cognatiyoonia sp. TaxID=2211652 RepID=UPI003F69D065
MLKHITVLGASAAALTFSTASFAQDADTVIATVGDVEITLGEMIIVRSSLPQQYEQFPPEILFEGIRDQLIQQQLLANAVNEGSKRLDLTIKNEIRALQSNEVVAKLTQEVATEEQLMEVFDARYGDAEPILEWNAAHLLVETEEEALAAKGRVDGGEIFTDVARDVSTGPSGPNGGNLGWFGAGRMVPAFEAATAELSVGEVSAPVETQFGWHVIILNETREQPPVTFEQVRGELVGELQEAAVQALLAQLETEYEVNNAVTTDIDPNLLTNFELLDD